MMRRAIAITHLETRSGMYRAEIPRDRGFCFVEMRGFRIEIGGPSNFFCMR